MDGEGDSTAEYRDDLARVMRPSRVRVNVSRRRTERPAPLVLVSEQRIDNDDATPAEPVHPRRVARAATPRETRPDEPPAAQPMRLETVASEQSIEVSAALRDEGATPPPRKAANALASLAQRAGMIMRGSSRRGGAALAEQIEDEPQTEAQAGATPEPAAQPAPATAGDHATQFARLLEDSDAVEIEDVVELGAVYLTERAGLSSFKRVQLVRLVRSATENSITREQVVASVSDLTDAGVLTRLGRGVYELGTPRMSLPQG